MFKPKDLEGQSIEELHVLERDLAREIFELRNELHMARKLEKPHLIRSKKRDRARILTILQKKLLKGEEGK